MGQLQAEDQVVVAAERVPVRLATFLDQASQRGEVFLVNQQLPRVGPALVENGGSLAPQELGTAGAEPLVAAIGQLVGLAVEGAVTAFHRLDAQGVAGGQRADRHRGEQGREVGGEADLQPEGAVPRRPAPRRSET